MFTVCSKLCKLIILTIAITGVPTPMEVDTCGILSDYSNNTSEDSTAGEGA